MRIHTHLPTLILGLALASLPAARSHAAELTGEAARSAITALADRLEREQAEVRNLSGAATRRVTVNREGKAVIDRTSSTTFLEDFAGERIRFRSQYTDRVERGGGSAEAPSEEVYAETRTPDRVHRYERFGTSPTGDPRMGLCLEPAEGLRTTTSDLSFSVSRASSPGGRDVVGHLRVFPKLDEEAFARVVTVDVEGDLTSVSIDGRSSHSTYTFDHGVGGRIVGYASFSKVDARASDQTWAYAEGDAGLFLLSATTERVGEHEDREIVRVLRSDAMELTDVRANVGVTDADFQPAAMELPADTTVIDPAKKTRYPLSELE